MVKGEMRAVSSWWVQFWCVYMP